MRKDLMMLRFMITGLLIAIGAVMATGHAQAQSVSRYCYDNPDDPTCDDDQPRYYDPGVDDEPAYDPGYDEPVYVRPPPRRYAEPPPSRCSRVRYGLERQGYRRLRALDCEGTSFKFRGVRNGRPVTIRVRSDGRIIAVTRG
jgi:hypothetical protein